MTAEPAEATGMYVALLTCGHSYGPGKGYVGPVPAVGAVVECPACDPRAGVQTIVDVILAGPILEEGRRW
jgi:hypothetical protein